MQLLRKPDFALKVLLAAIFTSGLFSSQTAFGESYLLPEGMPPICSAESAYLSPDSKYVYLVHGKRGEISLKYSLYSLESDTWRHGVIKVPDSAPHPGDKQAKTTAHVVALPAGRLALKESHVSWGIYDLLASRKLKTQTYNRKQQSDLSAPHAPRVRIRNTWYPRMQRVAGQSVIMHEQPRQNSEHSEESSTGAVVMFNLESGEISRHLYKDEKIVGWTFSPNGDWLGKYVKSKSAVFFFGMGANNWQPHPKPVTSFDQFYFPFQDRASNQLPIHTKSSPNGVIRFASELSPQEPLKIELSTRGDLRYFSLGDSPTVKSRVSVHQIAGESVIINWTLGTESTRQTHEGLQAGTLDIQWGNDPTLFLLTNKKQNTSHHDVILWQAGQDRIDICQSLKQSTLRILLLSI